MDLSELFSKKVRILGEDYQIEIKKPADDPGFKGRHAGAYGYCDYCTRSIVLADRQKDDWGETEFNACIVWLRKTLRHEIVHAFLAESGLAHNTKFCGNWADNEEMVDWIALQGIKIVKAWTESGAMDETDRISKEDDIHLFAGGEEIGRVENITDNGSSDCMTAQEET